MDYLTNLPRDHVRFISIILFALGALTLVAGGYEDTQARSTGIILMAGAIWFVVMSESLLLSKVQNEMQAAINTNEENRKREVRELLDFLHDSKIAASPLEGLDSAKYFISKLSHPALLLSPALGILSANDRLTECLGYTSGELDGMPAIAINDSVLMSYSADLANQPDHRDKEALSMRYAYKHRDGSRVYGSLHVVKIIDGCFFIIFHPDKLNILSNRQITNILKSGSESDL